MASDLPVDLLEILLRLDDADDLIRASAACASFRRVVSDGRFLRRFRSLHRPPAVGFLDCIDNGKGVFHVAQPPRRSAPAARAFAEAADFTFSFLYDSSWRVRDGRVLFSRSYVFEDLLVYDPLHRRHIQMPGIDRDLVPSVTVPMGHSGKHCFEPFLDPATEKEKETEEDLPFRVICNLYSEEKIRTFAFSYVTGKWRAVTSFVIETTLWLNSPRPLRRHYACNCFYWTKFGESVMLGLETGEMKFSVIDLLPESKNREKIVVEAVEGSGLLILGEHMLDLYSKTCPDNGVCVKDWRQDNAIPLLYDCYWSLGGVTEDYLLLRGVPRYECLIRRSFRENIMPDAQYFTVELKTLLVERLCVLNFGTSPDYLYASFPPSLSLPSL